MAAAALRAVAPCNETTCSPTSTRRSDGACSEPPCSSAPPTGTIPRSRRGRVTWRPLHDLLQSHTRHEDDHILRLLDGRGPSSAARAGDEHRDLDDLLDELTATVDRAVQHPDPTTGRAAYRDLCRFIAAYLPHLHAEETEVMPRIWELCSDEEIGATRAAFMAEIGDAEREYTIGLLLPSIDGPTRDRMMSALAGAPAG